MKRVFEYGRHLSMKIFNLLAATAIAVSISAGAAQAAPVSIDFTTLPASTTVTNQYAGVTFSLAGGLASGAPQTAYYGTGLSNSPSGGYYPTADSLVATFSSPVSDVSFTFDVEGYNGNNNYQVYNSSNVLIGSGALLDQTAPYILAASDIGSIVWSNGQGAENSWTQALSTLSYTTPTLTGAAPEPATWGMMIGGFGMAGGALRSRRRKTTLTYA
jgi:hypothetical protein